MKNRKEKPDTTEAELALFTANLLEFVQGADPPLWNRFEEWANGLGWNSSQVAEFCGRIFQRAGRL